jgi:hypothetical protein
MAGAVDSSSELRTPRAASSLISALCVLRSPACGGEGARALDCFPYFIARVIFVNFSAFTSILGFPGQEMVKGIVVIYVPTAFNLSSRPFEADFVKKNHNFIKLTLFCKN